jgi:hypothetical protein
MRPLPLVSATIPALILTLGDARPVHAAAPPADPAHRATHDDVPPAQGRDELDRLLLSNQRLVHALRSAPTHQPARELSPDDRSVLARIDRAAGQKDAAWSGLFWHTDLDRAKEVAARRGKPILSLRLLGRLDEERSCANSRLFRSVLYANERIGRELRDHWVLHWESVRPAPRITIAFGDGRTIESTITGNSIHYLLTPGGAVADALPGLYDPETFLGALEAFRVPLEIAARPIPPAAAPAPARPAAGPERPHAADAARLTVSKSMIEAPALRALGFRGVPAFGQPTPALVPTIDARSRALIRAQRPDLDATELWRMITTLESSCVADARLNETRLRPAIRSWLVADPSLPFDPDRLTDRVYAELFLTPASDPWLGLEPGVYTGMWSR